MDRKTEEFCICRGAFLTMGEIERIRTKQQLRQWLQYEKQRYPRESVLNYLLQSSEASVIWKHQMLLRKTEYHINAGHKLRAKLLRLRLNRMQNRYAIHIPPNVCGKGLKLMHVGPILMNERVVVGENCVFHINTALVAGGTGSGVPTLGDDVVLGIGAVVLGDTHIANGVAVGANAVVNRDVPEPNIAVAGVPAKKISSHGSLDWGRKG